LSCALPGQREFFVNDPDGWLSGFHECTGEHPAAIR
jgi:hypothetical protein